MLSMQNIKKKKVLPAFNSGLVWGDGCTLDSHVVFLCCQSRVDGDLVVCLVTVGQTQVKVLQLNINIGQDELCVCVDKMLMCYL